MCWVMLLFVIFIKIILQNCLMQWNLIFNCTRKAHRCWWNTLIIMLIISKSFLYFWSKFFILFLFCFNVLIRLCSLFLFSAIFSYFHSLQFIAVRVVKHFNNRTFLSPYFSWWRFLRDIFIILNSNSFIDCLDCITFNLIRY